MLLVQKQDERLLLSRKDGGGGTVLWQKGGKVYEILVYNGRKGFREGLHHLSWEE